MEKFIELIKDMHAECYETVLGNDEESRKTFRGYWLGNVSNQLNKIHHSKNPQYAAQVVKQKRHRVRADYHAR